MRAMTLILVSAIIILIVVKYNTNKKRNMDLEQFNSNIDQNKENMEN